jgi:hypothetical protein
MGYGHDVIVAGIASEPWVLYTNPAAKAYMIDRCGSITEREGITSVLSVRELFVNVARLADLVFWGLRSLRGPGFRIDRF